MNTMDSKNKKIFVTGGSGFLGSWIVQKLQEQGYKNITAPMHKDCNLLSLENMQQYLGKQHFDVIIHAAAKVGGIDYNRLYPADMFRENLIMAVNILDFAVANHTPKLVIAGSMCAYPGTIAYDLKEEDFLAGPLHPSVEAYGFSKRALYIGSRCYKRQHGLHAIMLVLTNLYGPRDTFAWDRSHVVSALIRKFVEAKHQNAEQVQVWGTGKAVREFLYVEDAAEAIIKAMEEYEDEEPLNVGTGIGTAIGDFAVMIKQIAGYQGKIIYNTTKPDGVMRKVSNVSKIKDKLHWTARYDLESGLKKTIDWFDKNYDQAIARK